MARLTVAASLLLIACAAGLWAGADAAASCAETRPTPGLQRFYSDGWGMDVRNTRHQRTGRTTVSAANVPGLTLKWSYALASEQSRSMPLVSEDTIFVGDSGHGLLALDRDTGCVRWQFVHEGEIGSAILHERWGDDVALFFVDRADGVFAVDALTGNLIWRNHPEGSNPVPLYSGTPLIRAGTLFMPLASQEIGLTLMPFYGCCHTSGGFAAMDSKTGDTRWYLPTIEEPVRTTGRRWLVVKQRGPSGAPVWGAPTLDEKRGLVYFGTGQNYSHPTSTTSDAVFAVDASTGERRWVRQFTQGDAYNLACDFGGAHPNCPDPLGPDVDFGAPPILATLGDGSDAVIAGQKSGDVHALRPEDGSVIWQQKLGRGGALGGVHWGIAFNAASGLVIVPISDIDAGRMTGPGEATPGVYALRVDDGSLAWSRKRPSRCADRVCWGGVSAAITITDDVVFAGSLDGFLEAIDARTGAVLWSFDTWATFDAVNGQATGGAFDAHGPMVADDLVIVTSGYSSFFQRGGNALLVFEVEEDES